MSNTDTARVSHEFNEQYAIKFAELALAHVRREYPNKLDHVLTSEADVQSPHALHPIFFGSFDWHSCVHGYWLLARVYRQFPHLSVCTRIRELFDAQFTEQNVTVETAYAAHPARSGFERPYGWAWLLKLAGELAQHESEEGRRWSARITPLADVFVRRFMEFLPKATYPIRGGAHFNTAFALILSHDYARIVGNADLGTVLRASAIRWYGGDRDAQAWEPSGDDFLSSTLIEAHCMQSALPAMEFDSWMQSFLPAIADRKPATLFVPAIVSDRSDGKIGHLDGLNLSRAWNWRTLAALWPDSDPRKAIALEAAAIHIDASLPHVAGDYLGEHWLATYALLALDTPLS